MTLRSILAVLGLALAFTLSGCTVPAGGHTGVSVDASGAPVAVVSMCEGGIDGLTLYFHEGEATPVVAAARTAKRVTAAEVALAAPSGEWTVATPLQDLTDGIEYTLFGSTSDNEWSSTHVDFTTASLAALSPEQVLRQRYDEKRDDFVDTVTSVDDFQTHACDGYSG